MNFPACNATLAHATKTKNKNTHPTTRSEILVNLNVAIISIVIDNYALLWHAFCVNRLRLIFPARSLDMPKFISKFMSKNSKYKACADHFLNNDTDVVFYSGSIDRDGYGKFCDLLLLERKKNLLLVLSTYGGDPNAGYRIARAAIHHYGAKHFRILVPGYCKSAGTLICIGAHSLVMANRSELGPLDIQLKKQDELFQQRSGLDILRGVTYLREEALSTFRSFLLNINAGSGLSTKVASEISSTLVIGLYQPLFEQVDPVKLGEMSAALQIAKHYGERLDEKSASLFSGALNNLIMEYPTHGFVIDRSEARQLFKRVEPPTEHEELLCCFLEETLPDPESPPIVFNFNTFCAPDSSLKDDNELAPIPQAAGDASNAEQDQLHGQQSTEHDGGSTQEHVEEQHPVRGNQGDEGSDEGLKEQMITTDE